MLILDTNVISELMREQPKSKVLAWVDSQFTDALYITADNIKLSNSETTLEVEFSAPSKKGISPVGLPSITLSDGTVVKASSIGNGAVSVSEGGIWDRTYSFPPIANQADSISIDLASNILYDYSEHTVNLPLQEAVSQTTHSSITESEIYEVNGAFSIGNAGYTLTSLILKQERFSITFEPSNEIARKTVVAASLSNATLQDNLGNVYRNGLTSAKWNEAHDEVVSQTLFFGGLLNQEATSFSLWLNGLGAIKTAGAIHVQVAAK